MATNEDTFRSQTIFESDAHYREALKAWEDANRASAAATAATEQKAAQAAADTAAKLAKQQAATVAQAENAKQKTAESAAKQAKAEAEYQKALDKQNKSAKSLAEAQTKKTQAQALLAEKKAALEAAKQPKVPLWVPPVVFGGIAGSVGLFFGGPVTAILAVAATEIVVAGVSKMLEPSGVDNE